MCLLVAALVGLAGLIASTTAGPEQVATLSCTGTQVTYREEGGARQSLAWSRRYTLYLKAKRYCETRCRADATLDEGDGSRLVLGDADYGAGSTPLTYQDATGAVAGEEVVSFGQLVSVGPKSVMHLQTRGTCQLQPGAPVQAAGAGGGSAASPAAARAPASTFATPTAAGAGG